MNKTWKVIWGLLVIIVVVMTAHAMLRAHEERVANLVPICDNESVSDEEMLRLTDRMTHMFGFVRRGSLGEGGKTFSMTFDEAEFLTQSQGTCLTPTGNEMSESEESGFCNPNGFLIRNTDPETRLITVGSDTTIVGMYSCPSTVALRLSPDELDEKLFMDAQNEDNQGLPVWISETDGVVKEITEQYLP